MSLFIDNSIKINVAHAMRILGGIIGLFSGIYHPDRQPTLVDLVISAAGFWMITGFIKTTREIRQINTTFFLLIHCSALIILIVFFAISIYDTQFINYAIYTLFGTGLADSLLWITSKSQSGVGSNA